MPYAAGRRDTGIQHKWLGHLHLDADALGLVVVDDLPEGADLEPAPDLPDEAAQ